LWYIKKNGTVYVDSGRIVESIRERNVKKQKQKQASMQVEINLQMREKCIANASQRLIDTLNFLPLFVQINLPEHEWLLAHPIPYLDVVLVDEIPALVHVVLHQLEPAGWTRTGGHPAVQSADPSQLIHVTLIYHTLHLKQTEQRRAECEASEQIKRRTECVFKTPTHTTCCTSIRPTHPSIHSSTHPPFHSFIHPPIHSCIHSFTLALIHPPAASLFQPSGTRDRHLSDTPPQATAPLGEETRTRANHVRAWGVCAFMQLSVYDACTYSLTMTSHPD
jgi:hypothetical protein